MEGMMLPISRFRRNAVVACVLAGLPAACGGGGTGDADQTPAEDAEASGGEDGPGTEDVGADGDADEAAQEGDADDGGVEVDGVGCPPQRDLDRLTSISAELLDTSGRQVTLRGVVSVTEGIVDNPLDLDAEGFDRIGDWGFNAQVIRLNACRLGLQPRADEDAECVLDEGYLEQIDRWVDLAEERSLYSMMKMTTYAVPSWGAGGAFNPDLWEEFWDPASGQQEAHLDCWETVWPRFAGRASVVGYDVLNEPHEGNDVEDFVGDRLYPFYLAASERLRAIDADALLLFQPGLTTAGAVFPPLDDPRPLFAPHLYATSLEGLDATMDRFVAWRTSIGAPMLIGEFGWPDREIPILPAWTPESEREAAMLCDETGVGAIRPWYPCPSLWGLINADGSEQTEKMDILSRPYPKRLAGRAAGWSFDFTTREFRLPVEPRDGATGPSEIAVPAQRHYPEGFVLEVGDDTFASDPASPVGLSDPAEASRNGLCFDFASETLIVDRRAESFVVIVRKP
jgi:hypothetical protein